ncbi:MAG: hypothetical protein JXL84_00945 [Deltaproteobacteria bacterium]|nr:hypothetical protein [Deltaproteobacteria bacterium]
MKTRKGIKVFGVVLLGVSCFLLVGKLGGCRPPGFSGGGFCPVFREDACPPVFRGKGFADHVLNRFDRQAEELNLSGEQRKSYEEIHARLKENLEQGHARRQGLFNQVRSELAKEKPDIDRVSGIIKNTMQEIPEHMGRDLDLFVSFYKILDDNQQRQVVETLQKRMKCGW